MIFSGFTNFPSIIIPKVSQRPLSPTSLQLQGGFFLRRGIAAAGRRAARTVGTQPAGGCILCRKRQKKGSNRFAGQGVRDEKPHVR